MSEDVPQPGPEATQRVARWLALGRELRASDLHLDPGREAWSLRARVDGVLQPVEQVPADEAVRALTRIKVIAGMLTYRTETPQDGRIATAESPPDCEVRVSTYPTVHGERAVLRFLEGPGRVRGLGDLGLSAATLEGLGGLVARPEGALLVTGPSGSGKTTSLYAILRAIAEHTKGTAHLVTIEDPVEVEVPGVTQTEIRPAVGLDFPAALRALLRHDPDGLLIGEVRDEETAKIAIRAALTGHFVLGTVHAGDTVGVFGRLLEMGVPAHLLAGAVRGVLAQRLVRLLCPECKQPVGTGPLFRPGGCDRCRHTGFAGRRIVDEWLVPREGLRAALVGTTPARDVLHAAALAEGLRPLTEQAEALVAEGLTTADELDRVLV